jgi:hypothetical protein
MPRWLVTASVVPSSPILVTLIKEALSSSETSGLIRAAWRNIPEDDILHRDCRENLISQNEGRVHNAVLCLYALRAEAVCAPLVQITDITTPWCHRRRAMGGNFVVEYRSRP